MNEPDQLQSEVDAILATAPRSTILQPAGPPPACARLAAVRDLLSALPELPAQPSLIRCPAPGSPPVATPLREEPLTVGRSSTSGLAIPGAPRLSKIHFSVSLTGSSALLRHLSTTNGTCINDIPCQNDHDYPLLDGDTITAGGMVFVFVQATSTAQPTA